ncbi:MAG: type VI secretion system baseplate subunit TssE [Magnetococcus sp. DMHC-1]
MASPRLANFSFTLLDRLASPDQGEHCLDRGVPDLEYLEKSIRRDTEELLNMRQRCLSTPGALTELGDSLLTYGIPDFSGANLSSEEQREAFRQAVEDAILRHEPRLRSVEVSLVNHAETLDRTLRFKINAYFSIDGVNSSELAFHSTFNPLTNSVAIGRGVVDG